MKKPTTSIIIPAYKEEAMITATLTEMSFFLNEQEMQDIVEVVVCVQGDDSTAEKARAHSNDFKHFQVIEPGTVGKGANVAAGMLAATGKIRIFTDADLATPLSYVPDMITRLEAGDDVCIGVRDIRKMHEGIFRRWSSMASNLLIRVMVAPGISDTQCGFKGFTEESAERIFSQLTIKKWGFDFEVIAMARSFGYKMSTIKIDDWSDPKGENGLAGESQSAVMIKTLRELVKVRLNLWKRMYR